MRRTIAPKAIDISIHPVCILDPSISGVLRAEMPWNWVEKYQMLLQIKGWLRGLCLKDFDGLNLCVIFMILSKDSYFCSATDDSKRKQLTITTSFFCDLELIFCDQEWRKGSFGQFFFGLFSVFILHVSQGYGSLETWW